jgi:hypothetical protein
LDPRLLGALMIGAAYMAARALGVELPGGEALGLGTGLALLGAFGHCDTLDGPVVQLARKALETGNVNLVLQMVRAEDEREIRRFLRRCRAQVQARRANQHAAPDTGRIHRASERTVPLKPAGRTQSAVPAADQALEDGAIETVIKLLTDAVREGVRQHFHAAYHRRRFDVNDVRAGREYVEAYVPYVHYVEGLWDAATGAVGHHAAHTAAHGEHAAHVH